MVNAQKWLDKEYPKNRRNEETKLDISKGKVKKLFRDRTLKGHLKLEGFTDLWTLIVSSHELTDLDVSECKNLRELDCSSNNLNNLNINGCPKLKKINCIGNDFLEEIDISNCPELTEIGSGFTRDTKNNRLVKGSLITHAKEDDIRNILIIGWAGNGKSTLANVLSETNVFAESAGGMGKTLNFKKSEVFSWNRKKYCIIDNIGFGDNNVPNKADLLYRVGQGIYSAKEGINQVLFVFSGRFSDEQIMAFNLFKNFINESGITEFTTLIRTNFQEFREQEVCNKDREDLLGQKEELSKIIRSCKGIIYVDNPAIPVIKEGDSEKKKKRKEQEIAAYTEDREESRKTVLDHLASNCQKIYKLKEWDSVYSRVVNYMKQIEEKEQELENTDNDSVRNRLQGEINKEKEKVVEEINVKLIAKFSAIFAEISVETEFKNIHPSRFFGSGKK